jgi:hypothetical protein
MLLALRSLVERRDAAASGDTCLGNAVVVNGQASGDAPAAVATGAAATTSGVLSSTTSVAAAGSASAGAIAPTATLSAAVAVIDEGPETGTAAAGNALLAVAAQPLAASADADALAAGAVVSVSSAVAVGAAAGTASGDEADAAASGDVLPIAALLLQGVASGAEIAGGGVWSGRYRYQRPSFVPVDWSPTPVLDGQADGAVIAVVTALLPGRAQGEVAIAAAAAPAPAQRARQKRRVRVAKDHAGVSKDASAAATIMARPLRLVAGTAAVHVTTPPATIACRIGEHGGGAEGFDAVAYDNHLITLLAA